jgi:ATP-dependent DNA helicase RecQ
VDRATASIRFWGFPRNPYHHLVKHYQDGRLQAGHLNDPERVASLVFEVLENQINALVEVGTQSPETLLAYHFLATRMDRASGFDAVFKHIRKSPVPDRAVALSAIRSLLAGKACGAQIGTVIDSLSDPKMGWPMAYALAWVSVAGEESVMPPWVRASFPQAALIVRELRDCVATASDVVDEASSAIWNSAQCACTNDAGCRQRLVLSLSGTSPKAVLRQ